MLDVGLQTLKLYLNSLTDNIFTVNKNTYHDVKKISEDYKLKK